MEAEHPVRIEDYSFVPDSCGAGQYRGGVGIRRSYRILAPEALLQMRTDRVAFPALRPERRRARRVVTEFHRDRQPAQRAAGQDHHHRRPRHADHSRTGRRRRFRQSAVAGAGRSAGGFHRRQDQRPNSPNGTTPSCSARAAHLMSRGRRGYALNARRRRIRVAWARQDFGKPASRHGA